MRGKFFAALVIGVLVSTFSAHAAEIAIGTGTSTWSYPLATYYHDARTQTIYLASEIGGAKTLTSLSLYVSGVPGQTMNNFTIRLKHTGLSSYGTSPVWDSTGWTTVYQANKTISATGWTTFSFTTSFAYNGTQNLMVDISFNNSSYTCYGLCRFTSSGVNRSLYYSTNGGYGDPLAWFTSGPVPYISGYFPNIRLDYAAVNVPDLVGMTQAAAQNIVTSANLTVGNNTYTFNDSIPFGSIISQSPAGGQTVPTQTPINLAISLGLKYSGSGTAENPYQIATKNDLLSLSFTPIDFDKYLVLTADIDLSGQLFATAIISPDVTYSYSPSYDGTAFTGIFDGNGHAIRNLVINTKNSYLGLFGCIGQGGQIKNLVLESTDISGTNYVGGLAGCNYGTIENCSVSGSVCGCKNTSSEDWNSRVGGLIGSNFGIVSNSFTHVYVNGRGFCEYIGGMIGQNSGSIADCSAVVELWGYSDTGGLVGLNNSSAMIINSFVSGSVAGGWPPGGLTGSNNGSINRCYSTCSVTNGGGFAANNSGTIMSCFWDIETSGRTASAGGIGKTTAEMQTLSTFTSVGWDFSNDDGNPAGWFMPEGDYPKLIWQLSLVSVPEVTGMTEAIAQTTLRSAGVMVGGVAFTFSEFVPAGIVMSQSPVAETIVSYRTLIDLTVSKGKAIAVPDVRDMWQADAQSSITLAGLTVGTGTTVYHNSVPAGAVISQSPASGTPVTVGSIVNFVVSLGQPVVPNVVGMPQSSAQLAVSSASLTIGTVSTVYHNSIVIGNIISQSPMGGTLVNVGSAVNLVISLGKGVTIPDVTGASQTGAQSALTSAGLIYTTSTSYHGSIRAGYVISQSPVGGQTVPLASAVNLVISSGKRYSGGSGTPVDPYLISSPQELNTVGVNTDDWSKCFKLTADINMSAYTGTQYKIIGTGYNNWFTGTFDGDGHTVRNLTYTTAASTSCVGLFGMTSYATIKNVGLENVSITTNGNDLGGLVGGGISGSIENCHSTGNITGKLIVGGLVGRISYCSITNCYSTGSVVGTGNGSSCYGGLIGCLQFSYTTNCYSTANVTGTGINTDKLGGLVGELNNSSIANCYSTGNVTGAGSDNDFIGGLVGDSFGAVSITNCFSTGNMTGDDYIGGLVGMQDSGTITNCFSMGSVTGDDDLGGLLGYQYGGSITNCFSMGSVAGDSYLGGLVGYQYGYTSSVKIEKSYSIGKITGNTNKGGLLGYKYLSSAMVTACFWDTQTSGLSTSVGGTGKTTIQMKTQSTFTSAGWDFVNIWFMNEYPLLYWEKVNPLQTRIDAASNGDTLIVQPGIYQGMLDFKGKNIILTSANPQDSTVVASTIIRGLGTGPVISFKGTETSACILQGFTIENGNGNGIYGGAASTSATIRNCVIRNNANAYNGGGIANCSGLIVNCILRNNTATSAGSALYQCNGQIANCTIVPPTSSAVSLVSDCSGSITNCILVGTGTIFNNCTGPITYSCYPGASGTSNISVDPLFINAAAGDYHLLPDSPCNDAGNPASDYPLEPLPNGGRIDMGAYGNTPEATNSRDGLVPLGFVIVSKTRVGRTSFEYELAVTVHNSNAFAMNNVQMKLMDWDAAVQSVSDDSITIDTILAGATVTSTDTFKIVVDRSTLINSSRLIWELTYYTVASGDQVQQAMMSMLLSDIDAGAPGGDISGDGKVNFDDFAILAGQWNTVPESPSADIAIPSDGYVGIEDLMYLAENWMK